MADIILTRVACMKVVPSLASSSKVGPMSLRGHRFAWWKGEKGCFLGSCGKKLADQKCMKVMVCVARGLLHAWLKNKKN